MSLGMAVGPIGQQALGGASGFFSNYSMYHEFWTEDPSWSNPGNGNTLSSWRNNGSAGNALVQAGGTALEPTYRSSVAALNSKPAIQFDGSGGAGNADYLYINSSDTATQSQPLTFGVVVKLDTTADQRIITCEGSAATRNIVDVASGAWRGHAGSGISGGTANTNGHLIVFKSNGASSVLRLDGTTLASGNAGSQGMDGIVMGRNLSKSTPYSDMHVAYWFMYVGDLTADGGFAAWANSIASHYGLTQGW